MTNRIFFVAFMSLLSFVLAAPAQEKAGTDKQGNLQQRAEAAAEKNNTPQARSLYIRAYEDYVRKGQMQQGVECGTKAAALFAKENSYQEAFDLLRAIDQGIDASKAKDKAALHYLATKERLNMYMKMHRRANAQEQLNTLERLANASTDEEVKNDLLYTKTISYYSFGQNERGNAVFKEMVGKLTTAKDYNKVDEVYKTLISNGRRSGSASMVAQTYSSYMTWKDSISALEHANEIAALKQQIDEKEAMIAERNESLSARKVVIVGISTVLAIVVAVLALGFIVLLRFVVLSRKQKRAIQLANENNALKAKFISNISAQMAPTLQKLDANLPEVRSMQEFTQHIQQLALLEQSDTEIPAAEETQLQKFCQTLTEQVQLSNGAILKSDVPNMSASIHREYVAHILLHLLRNAALHVNASGTIHLEVKKRGPHKLQFLVANTGTALPEEKRDDIFKPFLEVHDLTTGDGLGLPICRQMALRMDGELSVDPTFVRGTRFLLDLPI